MQSELEFEGLNKIKEKISKRTIVSSSRQRLFLHHAVEQRQKHDVFKMIV